MSFGNNWTGQREGFLSVVFSRVYTVDFQKGSALFKVVHSALTQLFSQETYGVGSGGAWSRSEREDVARAGRVMNGSWSTLQAALDQ